MVLELQVCLLAKGMTVTLLDLKLEPDHCKKINHSITLWSGHNYTPPPIYSQMYILYKIDTYQINSTSNYLYILNDNTQEMIQ